MQKQASKNPQISLKDLQVWFELVGVCESLCISQTCSTDVQEKPFGVQAQ